ncbi:potassium transporter Kef [Thermococcus aggregans]|uniref:Potassium transporter Kef n=1 Tax=Thermococcus aggregans TaxID=110163 RepID=A0A9E7SNG5_THEAG|nr:potassium transporter Kef [Thermococcus aggregans]USS40239.1 potassium transporter Kef [Thermococcus aggregans]
MEGREKRFLILNLLLGTVVLTALFHYGLSLSLWESLLFAGFLSLLYTSAYIFRKRHDKRQGLSQSLKSPYMRLMLVVLVSFGFALLLFELIYVAFAKPGTSFIPIAKMLGILFIISASVLFLVANLQEKSEKKLEKVGYSWQNFLKELSTSLLVFAVACFSGVGLEKSVSMALYVFVLAGWYYSMMAHKYVVPDRVLKIRAVVNFAAVTSGLYLFVLGNIVLSALIGAFFAFVSEKDYEITRKLIEEGLLERKYAEIGAGRLFYAVFYGLGVMVALMVVTGDYSASSIRESLLTMFRLLYIFTTIFLPFETLIGWLRLKLRDGGTQ